MVSDVPRLAAMAVRSRYNRDQVAVSETSLWRPQVARSGLERLKTHVAPAPPVIRNMAPLPPRALRPPGRVKVAPVPEVAWIGPPAPLAVPEGAPKPPRTL